MAPDTVYVDMHMHSTASDGEDAPQTLAARCAEAGLTTIALTDHNSMANVVAMTQACAGLGLTLIPACEISTRWQGREHHCLAYFVPLDDQVFQTRIERVRQADLARSRVWVENAASDGVPLRWEQVEAELGADRVPPFSLLADMVLAAAHDDARLRGHRGSLYSQWFAPGRPWGIDGAPYQPELPEAIAWVREAGGVPVLAHPGASLGPLDPEATLREMAGHGLGGVEAWTTWHAEATAERYAALGAEVGLAVTAGADYHGPRVKHFVKAPGQVTHNDSAVLDALVRARA